MGKNARDQIPPPVVRQPSAADQQLAAAGIQPHDTAPPAPPRPVVPTPAEREAAPTWTAPSVTELAARAMTNGATLAREYAAAAAELCRTADTNQLARANARRLLRLALAHLEA